MTEKKHTDICMVVHNDVTHDARVLKEAATLAAQGWSVVVVGITRSGYYLPAIETVKGFTIVRATVPKWYRNLSTKLTELLLPNTQSRESQNSPENQVNSSPEIVPNYSEITQFSSFYYKVAKKIYGKIYSLLLKIYGKIYNLGLKIYVKIYNLGLKIYNILFNPTGYGFICMALMSGVVCLRRVNARVYHGHDFPGLFNLALAGIWQRPIVYDSHELYFDQWSPEDPPPLFQYLRPWEKRLAQRTSGVITVSEGIADQLEGILGVARPLVIRNAVELRARQETATIYPTNGCRTVVHSGLITIARHLPELVKSLTYLPRDIVLVLMGDGFLKTELIEIAQSLGVAERLVIVPPVEPNCVANTLAQADIGAVLITTQSLHYDYSLPNKFFESIAAGLPLVVSPCKEIAELTKKYDMGQVCNPTEPAEIAQAILKVLEPENLVRYRANVLKTRDELLNWEQEEQKLISLYKKILCVE